MKFWIIFAVSAALFWGAYVPTIGLGQAAFGGKSNPNSSMRAFLFIGLAYFVMAILIPGVWILTHPSDADTGFNFTGGWLSTLAGALGAAGALCVVFSLKNVTFEGDSPISVAPIVFAGAPIISVLVAWALQAFKGEAHKPHPLFLLGLAISIVGVVLVLRYTPAVHGGTPPATRADEKKVTPTDASATPPAPSASNPSSGPTQH